MHVHPRDRLQSELLECFQVVTHHQVNSGLSEFGTKLFRDQVVISGPCIFGTRWIRDQWLCDLWFVPPRVHVAKFYGRLRLIRSVLRAFKFFRVKIDWNCNFVGLLHHPFWLHLVLALSGNHFQLLNPHCLAKDHWWGFITRNAHMVHIVNSFSFKMVYTS